MVSTAEANLELRTLWKEVIDNGTWPAVLPKLWPAQFEPTIDTPTLVFIGMNPSFAKRDSDRAEEKEIEDTSVLSLEDGRSLLCKDITFAQASYFKYFDDFVQGTRLKQVHLDMLAVRHTSQDEVRKALCLDGKWSSFAMKQFAIFQKLLERIDAPVIVVPNAYASHKLKSSGLIVGEMAADHGCHWLQLNGREIPIFLAGMLTGQGAMDEYSRQRLICAVRRMIASLGY
jgi:hypothetical protein